MKKLLAILLAMTLLLAFTACNDDGGGISQAEYDRVVDELNRLKEQNNNSGNGNNNDVNSPYSSVKVSDIIQFGGYDWRVLDIQDGKALIISEQVLTKQTYHSSSTAVTWETCDLRAYLNGSFYDNTFTISEKSLIVETRISNKANPKHGTPGGIDTIDKVFLLSIEEAEKYFADNSARIAVDKDTGNTSSWWLRSPGSDTHTAANVNDDGDVGDGGDVYVIGNFVFDNFGGVRPALWLNL